MYGLGNITSGGGVDLFSGLFDRLTMQNRSTLNESARAALIEAVATSKDRSAFIALFEFYAPRIKSQAMRFGLDASTAEDIAQDAMLAVWRRATQFDAGRGNASSWVFTIATNARIDRMRRDKHLVTSIEIGRDEPLIATETEDYGADAQRLQSTLSRLPEEQKQIVQLSFYRDMPHAEIAAHLGVPLGTVKSRIRLAIGKLRQALQDNQ